MKITKVWAVYFSPTGNTKKVITTMAKKAAEVLSVPMETFDFTLPENREGVTSFESEDLVFFSTPVYAGRIPNKMLPYVQSAFEGNGAFAVPVSVFGNRNFDNGLIELRNELELHGFHTIAAAGIPTEHVFSNKLATGRPDADDLAKIAEFGEKVAKKVADMTEIPAKIEVRGDDPVTAYYTPLGTDGKPAVFLKAKPKTRRSARNAESARLSVRWDRSRRTRRIPAPESASSAMPASRHVRPKQNILMMQHSYPMWRC